MEIAGAKFDGGWLVVGEVFTSGKMGERITGADGCPAEGVEAGGGGAVASLVGDGGGSTEGGVYPINSHKSLGRSPISVGIILDDWPEDVIFGLVSVLWVCTALVGEVDGGETEGVAGDAEPDESGSVVVGERGEEDVSNGVFGKATCPGAWRCSPEAMGVVSEVGDGEAAGGFVASVFCTAEGRGLRGRINSTCESVVCPVFADSLTLRITASSSGWRAGTAG